MGTFELGSGKVDKAAVKRGIRVMQEHIPSARAATLVICLEGIKVIDTLSQKVAMAHALGRVSFAHHPSLSVYYHSSSFFFLFFLLSFLFSFFLSFFLFFLTPPKKSKISLSSVDSEFALFGFVAKNPGGMDKFCHVFVMKKQRHADEVQALVSKAFKLAFTQDRTLHKVGFSILQQN